MKFFLRKLYNPIGGSSTCGEHSAPLVVYTQAEKHMKTETPGREELG